MKKAIIVLFLLLAPYAVMSQSTPSAPPSGTVVSDSGWKTGAGASAPDTDLLNKNEAGSDDNAAFLIAKSGCCSHHGGVAGCDNASGRQRCRDGSLSPSCMCGE